jgi:hypothetical protein
VLSPLKTVDSWNPLGSVAARLGLVRTRRKVQAAAAARKARTPRPVKIEKARSSMAAMNVSADQPDTDG